MVVEDRKLPGRARDGDGQPAAGVHVAQQHVGHGVARFLTQIPAVGDGGHRAVDVHEAEWAAAEQQYDHGLAGFAHGIHQLVLHGAQLEARVVPVVADPRLMHHPGSGAERQHHHVSLACDIDRLTDQALAGGVVGQASRTEAESRAALRQARSLGVEHSRVGSEAAAERCKRRDARRRSSRVVAALRVVCVRADQGDGAQCGRIQRQEAAVVLQHRDGLTAHPSCSGQVVGVRHDPLCLVRVHIGILEQAHVDLGPQDAAHGPVDHRLVEAAGTHQRHQVVVGFQLRHVDVHAGGRRESCRLGGVLGNEVRVPVVADAEEV